MKVLCSAVQGDPNFQVGMKSKRVTLNDTRGVRSIHRISE